MAKTHFHCLVFLSLISLAIQNTADNKVDSKDESPLSDVAKEILKENNLENIGGMVNSFLQTGGAKQVMDGVLQNLASGENSGQLLESLGNLLNSAGDEKDAKKSSKTENGDINPMDLISGLGSLVGTLQGAGGGGGGNANPGALLQGLGSLLGGGNNQGGAALLQGLGSLLGSANKEKDKDSGNINGADLLSGLGSIIGAVANQGGGENNAGALLQGLGSLMGNSQGGQGGINADMIGNMISMFASSDTEDKKEAKPAKEIPKKAASEKVKAKKAEKPKTNDDDSFDLDGLLNIASSFLGSNDQGKSSGGSNFMEYIPMIMNTINAFTGPEAQQRAESHAPHSWSLPPVLEKIHLYYDNFLHSGVGKTVIDFLGGQPTLKVFRDKNGNFSYLKFEELIENHSFRRHWIEQIVGQLVELLRIVSDEKTFKQYYNTGIMFTNSFLTKYGFPKKALIDPKKPSKSISNFANYAARRYLDTDFNAKEYVEPAVLFIQDLLKMAKKSLVSGAESKKLVNKLTDTLNMEIIEPITRVNRAFRFARAQPQCDKYVFCLINQEVTSISASLPTIKKGLYKSSSLIAAWFISLNTGTPYWDLYAIVTENKPCDDFHKETCSGFFEEEIKATTEYVHNEL